MAKPVKADLDFEGQARATGLPNPVNPSDAANKSYVDAQIATVGGSSSETGPALTWVSGQLTLITYDSGNTKTLSYNGSGQLTQIDYDNGTDVIRKTLSYNTDGTLASITQTVL